jgi:hypothetical protein
MQKRAELVKTAGIEEVKDPTSLYAKYGMLPDGKSNQYKNLLSAPTELERKFTPVKLEHGIKEHVTEMVSNEAKTKAVGVTSQSIDESSVVKDLMPKAQEILKEKKNGDSVTIVSYKFNPQTGQLDPKEPQAAATFKKDEYGQITGEKVTEPKAADRKDLNVALIKAQKQALLANVDGSKCENKEDLKAAIEAKFTIKKDQEAKPLNEKDFKDFSQKIQDGNLAQVKVEVEESKSDIKSPNTQTPPVKKGSSNDLDDLVDYAGSTGTSTGKSTTVSSLANQVSQKDSGLTRQSSTVSALNRQGSNTSFTSGNSDFSPFGDSARPNSNLSYSGAKSIVSTLKQSDDAPSNNKAVNPMKSVTSISPGNSTTISRPFSAVVQGTGGVQHNIQ